MSTKKPHTVGSLCTTEIDDKGSAPLARDISKKIESELQYPGEIKVTVLREIRTVEYAR